ncbi:MAG TPA: prolyl oligopeptidase family serine peptidase [Gemmatimonadales bacterium]|nr:prolyl oligopeptidase family serine peptidase [Gemmatimonadales bacterium]
MREPPTPPITHRDATADLHHGVRIPDPYRWLEDPDTPDARAWIDAENRVTEAFLAGIPERQPLRERLTAIWNYAKQSVPFREAGRYFFFRNEGLQPQAVLYARPALDAPAEFVLDPNTLSPDGTTALSTIAVSRDGMHLAYGISESGSDWQEIRVRSLATGDDRADRVRWIKFSGAAWTHDSRGFFYSRYPEPTAGTSLREANRNQELYYHVLGEPQERDRLIYRRRDQPEWGYDPSVTDDGRYLILHVWHGTDRRNRLYYADLGDPTKPLGDVRIVPLLDAFDAAYHFVGNDGPVFYVQTDRDASRGRLVAIDTRAPDTWREIIPEADDVLVGARHVAGAFAVLRMRDACSVLRIHEIDGSPRADVPLPALGAIDGLSGKAEDRELFFDFTSYLHPTTVMRYDFATGETSVVWAPELPVDLSRYETRQVFVRSKDGTRVPMFLTHRRDLPRNGDNPVYLYGYGGFSISLTPAFSPSVVCWLERGGVFAVANLRGGGEYGEAWHAAGMLRHKQNVFDDFIAAAEYLIAERYTAPKHLAIGGGSNGGLLVGAAVTQRPELFGAAVPAVGVFDMLRYHKFTIGWAWAPEYGTADDAEMFKYLMRYSPLHNVRDGVSYPAMLLITADHDDRVVPAHSFKFAAALQAANAGPNPILIRIETKAGHGAGKPTDKVIAEQADKWAFLVEVLGMRDGGD